ncbi:UTP--glucose-1-phosphate uridylyltransferase [Ornithinicoccus halotolerans]|uniref:UTP--glucose-1-phosphate uridylyltransferase n=1 Tax=Ornithinicoccus halotolerans TaxID=1748220 RepID=UPI001297C1B1|nr:UTP--glucose-1-phosphate uridylyltransferase [Ornithinicoccus halotolerans]
MTQRAGSIRKAVIPVAGLGTRFVPATKAVPKELLPVVDRPAIEYIVEEAVRAGCTDVLMVTGRGKGAIEDHFDQAPELQGALEAKGDDQRAGRVGRSSELGRDVHFVRQGEALGLGHAVLRGRAHVGDEPFAVLLGDDMIDEEDRLLERMLQVQTERGGSVVALMEVPPEHADRYGCAEATPLGEDLVQVTGLVEKPAPEEAPSNLAVIGRYVLHPRIFEELERTQPGKGGEIQLTDAMLALANADGDGAGVTGVVFRGRRYDTGDRLEYLKAVVQLGERHPELGEDFRAWLQDRVPARGPA